MDSVNIRSKFSSPLNQRNQSDTTEVKQRISDATQFPRDVFISGDSNTLRGNVVNTVAETLVTLMDVQVPTTTKPVPQSRIDEMMSVLKPGDIIMQSNDSFPGWQVIEKIAVNADYGHVMMYEGDGKFIHSTSGPGVQRLDLAEYMKGARINLEVVRPDYKTEEDRDSALNYMRSQIGKPYDSSFVKEDESRHYCSELITHALSKMPNPIDVPAKKVFGKEIIAPDAFQDVPGMETVYSTGSSFLKSVLSHYPLCIAQAVTATVGALTLGPLGLVAGAVGGGILAIMAGNRIQSGKFSLYPHMS